MLCGAQIHCRRSTGRREFGAARPAQRMGDQVHALPQAGRGEMQDCIKGVICGVSVRVGNSIGRGVDSGVGYEVGSAN